MVKFENVEVFNFEGALRGMRNPMDSWAKSDSMSGCEPEDWAYDAINDFFYENYNENDVPDEENDIARDRFLDSAIRYSGDHAISFFCLGKNDLGLAQKLIRAGGEHRKFMRQILVSVDITAPRFWWAEFDTYKVGTTANSCSTMHKLKDYPFTSDMFNMEADEDLTPEDILHWVNTLTYLENLRVQYNETKDYKVFRKMKNALPEGFFQKRTVTLNYENILNMRKHRRNHKLSEWYNDFEDMIFHLPYANELLLGV